MVRNLLFSVAIISQLCLSTISEADQSPKPAPGPPVPQKRIKLDNYTYSPQELLDAFIEIAFDSYILPNSFPFAKTLPPYGSCMNENPLTTGPSANHLLRYSEVPAGGDLYDKDFCWKPEDVRLKYPWLYEYLYREHGFPRFFAINKWTSPIQITLGYPNDLKPITSSSSEPETSQARPSAEAPRTEVLLSDWQVEAARHIHPDRPSDRTSDVNRQAANETEKFVKDEIQASVPLLNQLTGLPVSYVPHERESVDHPANMRIIIADRPTRQGTNLFKEWRIIPAGEIADTKATTSSYPPSYGVSFQGHTLGLERRLLTAVHFTPYSTLQVDGYFLPNADNSIGMSFCFIAAGNDEATTRALVRECLVRSLGLPDAPRLLPAMVLGLWNDQTSSLGHTKAWFAARPPITEFDKFMVKLLYSKDITPGMSITDVHNVIVSKGLIPNEQGE